MIASLSEYKEFLEIPISNPNEDDFLQDLIDEVEEWLKTYLGRELESAEYIEKYDGDGTKELITKQSPITEFTKLEIYSGFLNGSEIWNEWTQGIHFNRMVIKDVLLYIDGTVFPKGIQNIRLTYTAGYTSIPKEIKLRAKELLVIVYNETRGMRSIGVSSTTKSGGGINDIISIDSQAVNAVLRKLDSYRSMNV
jgi:hypothetical protein